MARSTQSPRAQHRAGVDDGIRTHDSRDHNPGLYQLSYVHRRHSIASGAPGRTRTCDPRLRRPMLYPAELRARPQEASKPPRPWSGQRDLNPRPSAPKADALPDCAMPRPNRRATPSRTRSTGARMIRNRLPERQFNGRAARSAPPRSRIKRRDARGPVARIPLARRQLLERRSEGRPLPRLGRVTGSIELAE